MTSIVFDYEPLQSRPPHRQRRRSQFGSTFTQTLDLLERELAALGVRCCVLQVDADRSEFRLDGMLRAMPARIARQLRLVSNRSTAR